MTDAAPKRRGRPPLGGAVATELIKFRVTLELKQLLIAAAAEAGETLSAWATKRLERAAKR